MNYPELKYSYVRTGVALYGVKSLPDDNTELLLDLRPVLSLKSRVVLIRQIEKETQLDMAGALSQSVAVKSQFCQSDMAMDFREVYRTVMAEC